tara:strand:- start:1970 stop:2278 length:309 start_codon:yes stop_codon:yes gene_type:complete
MDEQPNRKAEMVTGMTSRQSRFRRDTLNYHLQVFDENRGVNSVETYKFLIEEIGLSLRKDLGITKADLADKVKPVVKEKPIEKSKDRITNKVIPSRGKRLSR